MDDLREKVIRGMECMVQISGKGCKECKYTKECDGSIATMYAGTVQMTIDALSLLKAQEPRVMTLEEVAKWIDIPDESKDPIFVEYGRKMKFGHSGWRTQFFGFSPKFHAKIYGVELRCWTSRPTDEQREAVKWDE